MLNIVTVKFVLLIICNVTPSSGILLNEDHWNEMDPKYDLTYLDPVDELSVDSTIGCAVVSLNRNVTAFGYQISGKRCHLYNVDYYFKHKWTEDPGFRFYLRNEDISADDCLPHPCSFCMPILETQMTWTEADAACRTRWAILLDLIPRHHRCVAMQLQYLRKSTTKRYWIGGEYDVVANDWTWRRHGQITGSDLWATGEPDNPTVKRCTLLIPGGNYTAVSADCSEKHQALCIRSLHSPS